MKNNEVDGRVQGAKPLPKWVMYKYAKLWKNFQQREFDYSEALEIVDENTSVVINFLKKRRWMTVALHPEDSRKRLYRLRTPQQVIGEIE